MILVVIPEGVRVQLQPVAEHLFRLHHPAIGQRHRLVLFVDDEVAGRFERLAFFGFRIPVRDRAGVPPGRRRPAN